MTAQWVEVGELKLEVSPIASVVAVTTGRDLLSTDAGKILEVNSSSPQTITIPPNASVAFPVGTLIGVMQRGTGQVAVAAGTGVTFLQGTPVLLAGQGAELIARKRATDEWTILGQILGYDTERSTDHAWGPRLQLFVEGEDAERGGEIAAVLTERVPATYEGWATHFSPGEDAPVSLQVEIREPADWFESYLGFDPAGGVTVFDWLATPTQLLLTATAGAVFHDGLDALEPRRRALAWYPHDVWLYVIAAQWRRVAQEEPFVGRTGELGDDLGSRIVAGRVVRDLMRLCFILERRYPPYSKWLGHAFERLACASTVGPHLGRAMSAVAWQRREAELGAAAELLGKVHNELAVSKPVDASLRPFHGRPFLVLDSGRFADAAYAAITDPQVRALPRDAGAVDQWIDSTDVLADPVRARGAARWMLV